MPDREKLMKIYHDSVIELHQQSGQVNHDDFLIDRMIAHGVTVQEWIPVKDRLPEQYHSVIVWTSDKELGEAAHNGKQFRWVTDDEYANVTHWIEFPQPPKGE